MMINIRACDSSIGIEFSSIRPRKAGALLNSAVYFPFLYPPPPPPRWYLSQLNQKHLEVRKFLTWLIGPEEKQSTGCKKLVSQLWKCRIYLSESEYDFFNNKFN